MGHYFLDMQYVPCLKDCLDVHTGSQSRPGPRLLFLRIFRQYGLKSVDCSLKQFLIPHFCSSYLRWPSGRAGPGLWTNHSAARHQASQSEPGWGRISQSVIRWEDVCVGMGWDKARDLALLVIVSKLFLIGMKYRKSYYRKSDTQST